MKNAFPIMLALAALTAGCMVLLPGIPGSGVSQTETREVYDFTRIDLSGSGSVALAVGDPGPLQVSLDDNLLQHFQTSVNSGTLTIGPTANIQPRVALTIEGTIPPIDELRSSGSSIVQLTGIHGDAFSLTITGSGSVNVSSGKVKRLTVTITGSGTADLSGLQAEDVEVMITGSGNADVVASTKIDVSVTGSGNVAVQGSPEQRQQAVTGSGAVTFH